MVITGCTRGIGRALLEWFAAAGHRVAGCGSSEDHVIALREAHPRCLIVRVDVRDEKAVAVWLDGVHAELGTIDLLVCCAGILPAVGNLWEIEGGEWSTACEVNIQGLARVLRYSVPKLRAPGGVVVLFSSRYGRAVNRGLGCYSATKWSTEAISKTLALELQDMGISVVSLDPGIVDTDMLRASNPSGAPCGERDVKEFAAEICPFMLSLSIADTGRNLTAKGSPAGYFQTGVPYKDRPDWANGFGKFVRACDEGGGGREDVGGCAAGRMRQREEVEASTGSAKRLRYFISGVMLGSARKLENAAVDLAPQDYRDRLTQIIRNVDPHAKVVEPLKIVKERAAALGKTIEEMNQDSNLVRDVFSDVVAVAAECDIVVSNLPEASMGSAAEIWEARKAGKTVFTISPMTDNWLLRSTTHHNFEDLDDFEQHFHLHLSEYLKRLRE